MKHSHIMSATALLLLAAMTACGSADDAGTQTTDTAAGGETTAAVTEEVKPAIIDALGEYDFGGEAFNMLIRDVKKEHMIVEEAIGEVYNDALYERNRAASERFNIEITYQGLEDVGATWNKQISASVMANDGAYDAVFPDYWWGCETGGYFLDLREYDDIMAFDKPWWTAGWNDNAEVYGQMYSAVGSMCNDIYSNTIALFFNKSILTSLDLESPYELVRDHKWTLDKMLEMSAEALSDLNGDGVYDIGADRFGAYFDLQSGRALLPSAGWVTSVKKDDGTYAYEFYGEDFIELYDKVYDIIWNTPSVNFYKSNDGSVNVASAFKDDRILFFAQGIGVSNNLRDMETDFGIVPYPLRDENQEKYVSYNFGTSYIAIPKSAANPEKSAVILEALNAESYNTVKDAYFEINMKEKFSRDEDTQEMLDMIIDNLRFDFTFVNESATDHIVMYPFGQIDAKNANIASAYEKREKAFNRYLEKLFETYAETANS